MIPVTEGDDSNDLIEIQIMFESVHVTISLIYVDGSAQDGGISIALATVLRQTTDTSMRTRLYNHHV